MNRFNTINLIDKHAYSLNLQMGLITLYFFLARLNDNQLNQFYSEFIQLTDCEEFYTLMDKLRNNNLENS